MENTGNEVSLQDTIPAEDTRAEEAAETATEGTPESLETKGNAAESEQAASVQEQTEPEFVLGVQFNHESRNLTRKEATEYAQIGMKFKDSGIDIDSVKPVIHQLDYIAAQRNCSVAQVVEDLMKSDEAAHRNELIEKFGEDNTVIDDLMKLYRDKGKEKYSKILSDRKTAEEEAKQGTRQSLENRLADEFGELKAEFPEIREFKDLPPAVKRAAADGRNLLSAYLYHLHSENKRIAAAQKTAAEAGKSTMGSAADGNALEENSISAMLRGLWG